MKPPALPRPRSPRTGPEFHLWTFSFNIIPSMAFSRTHIKFILAGISYIHLTATQRDLCFVLHGPCLREKKNGGGGGNAFSNAILLKDTDYNSYLTSYKWPTKAKILKGDGKHSSHAQESPWHLCSHGSVPDFTCELQNGKMWSCFNPQPHSPPCKYVARVLKKKKQEGVRDPCFYW